MVELASLLGSWQLISALGLRDGIETDEQPFGSQPQGFIHYIPDGRMAALIAHMDQAVLPDSATAEERWTAARLFTAYGGTYTVAGNVVTHHVDICSNPIGIGCDYVRYVELNDDLLLIRTPNVMPVGRPMSLVWRRIAALELQGG